MLKSWLMGVAFGLILLVCGNMYCQLNELREQNATTQIIAQEIVRELENVPDFNINDKVIAHFEGTQLLMIERVDSLQASVEQHYTPPEAPVNITYSLDTLALSEYNTTLLALSQALAEGDSVVIAALQVTLEELKWQLYTPNVDIQSSGWCNEPSVGFVAVDDRGDLPVSVGTRLYYNGHWGGGLCLSGTGLDSLSTCRIGAGPYIDYRGFIRGLDNLSIGGGVTGGYDFESRIWDLRPFIGLWSYL